MLLGEAVVPLLASVCWAAVAAVLGLVLAGLWLLWLCVAVLLVLSVLQFAVLCLLWAVGTVVRRALVPGELRLGFGTAVCTVYC